MTEIPSRLRTALADRYTIERELGAGGMATVYLAEDLKHKRKVAVKVLRPEVAATLGAERFLREVTIAANLQHPHILPVYDSGEVEGFLYYVMPYVEGESLRDRLTKHGELPLSDAVRILRDVADAMAAAHAKGVVHRDIKPENVMLSGRHALVADFGVAKAVSEATGRQTLTTAGVALGTPTYMAPEQAAADPNTDHRADLYAFGVMAYEMLTGQPPFAGATPQAVLAAHVTEAPLTVTQRRATIPPSLAQLVMRCLEKRPADRPQSADALLEVLELVGTPGIGTTPAGMAASTSAARRSRNTVLGYVGVALIAAVGAYTLMSRSRDSTESAAAEGVVRLAVLPLQNLGASEDDYFAQGMTEELTSRIAGISGILVISRTSAMLYKDSDKTLRQIGEELGVDYVLEGTARTDRAPDGTGQVRVTPQLIRVSDDAHLWTDGYTAGLVPGEILGVQEQIAIQVARALDVALLEPERRRLAAKPTDNPEAYDMFLRGNDYLRRSWEAQDRRIAIQMYQQAIQLDPRFALAYARLSYAHSWMWWDGGDRRPERLAMAWAAVDSALRLDPDLPAAHAALGWYYYWGHLDYDRALAEFATALDGEPNNADVISGIGSVQRRQGKTVEALGNYLRAAELDPRNVLRAWSVAQTYTLLRGPVDAERYFDRAMSLGPDWLGPYVQRAEAHIRLEGRTDKARTVLELAESRGLGPFPLWWPRLDVLDRSYAEAVAGLSKAGAAVTGDVARSTYHSRLAQVYDLMGNGQLARVHYDSARSMLETTIREHPDDPELYSHLGIVYAGLDRNADAIRVGQRAAALLPVTEDAWYGAHPIEDLARIYAAVGEFAEAIDLLEGLLSVPSPTAVAYLRIDPAFDALREEPLFKTLLSKHEEGR